MIYTQTLIEYMPKIQELNIDKHCISLWNIDILCSSKRACGYGVAKGNSEHF